MPFADELDDSCQWAHRERRFTAATVNPSSWHAAAIYSATSLLEGNFIVACKL
jgi:hypothetical protein